MNEAQATIFLSLLGIEPTDHPRILASISDDDWAESMRNWEVGETKAAPALKAKAAVSRGAAVLLATGKRLGEPPAPPPVAAPVPEPMASPSVALSKFKLNTITSQTSDVELRP